MSVACCRALACYVLLVVLDRQGLAQANEAYVELDSERPWIVSVETGLSTFQYDFDASVTDLRAPSTPRSIRGGEEAEVFFRIGAELMGPIFESLPGRPRLFLQAGSTIGLISRDALIAEGDPAVPGDPERAVELYRMFGPLGMNLPQDFRGQGSRLLGEFDPSWYAGLGISFSVPIMDYALVSIKPSLQYRYENIEFRGKLTSVFEANPGVDPPNGPYTRVFEIRRSSAATTISDHRIGPGLELAFVLPSSRSIRFSVFGNVNFLWLVSGDATSFGDGSGVAIYEVQRESFGVTGGAGMRISWAGRFER